MIKLHSLFLLVIGQLFSTNLHSSNAASPADSFFQILRSAKSDMSRVKALNGLANYYMQEGNNDSAFTYCNQSIHLAEQSGNKKGLTTAFKLRGQINNEQGNYPQAIKDFQSALKVYKLLGDKKSVADMYNYIANGFHQQQDFPNALKHQYAALKLREEIHDEEGIAWSYNNIGTILRIQGDYVAALNNYFKSMRLLEKSGEKKMVALSYNNIGNVYALQGKYVDALNSYISSLKIRQSLRDRNDIAASYLNIGDAFCDLFEKDPLTKEVRVEFGDRNFRIIPRENWLDTAMRVHSFAHTLNLEQGNTYYMIYSLSGMGRVNFLKRNYSESIRLYTKAYAVAEELNELELQKEIAEYLANNYSQIKDFKSSLHWYTRYTEHKDTLFVRLKSEDLTRTRLKFEFEQKESAAKAVQDKKDTLAKAELIRQMKMRNVFIAGFVVVCLFAGLFFYQRNNVRKEKNRSDELLLNILPEEVAEELKQKGSADAKQFADVTVMFTDFKNFTQISERLTPTELVAEIHTYFKAFDEIIEKHNIEKIKTIGDSYMCAGGLPVINETNASDVVSAALEIQNFVYAHNRIRMSEGKEVFEIRIGVHTGPVVAGIVGVKKYAYDIWGDTVNIASRMESSSDAGKVNISGATYALVSNKFSCTYRGKIQAKNKGEIDMYFVEEGLDLQ